MSGYIRAGEYSPGKSESTLPYDSDLGSPTVKSVVYNNRIHIIIPDPGYGTSGLWRLNGSTWERICDTPGRGSSNFVVYNNKIHVLGIADERALPKLHYSWNGSSWVQESVMPAYVDYSHTQVAVYNNKIYLMDDTKFYYWDGTTWTNAGSSYYSGNECDIIVYNNKIHAMDSEAKTHHSWNGSSWIFESTLPYGTPGYCGFIVYDNELHMLGGGDFSKSEGTNHYSWNGSRWKERERLSFKFDSAFSTVVYNSRIHVLGSWETGLHNIHYSLSRFFDYGTKKIKRAWFPVKSGYTESSGKPVLTFENKSVRRAWIMTQNQGLKLVLKPISSYFKYFNCPVSFRGSLYDSAAIKHNGKIHVLAKNQHHYSFDGLRWALEEQDLLPFINTRNVVSVNGKINVLGTYDSSTGNYTKEHWSWNGSSWKRLVDLPITFGPDGACCVVGETTTGNPPYIHIFWGYNHYGINPDTGINFPEANNPYNFHYGIVYYDPELRGLDGSIVMIGGSSTSTYANRIYHYNLNAQTVEELWVRNNYDFPERIGEGYSSAIVLYDEDHARYGDYAYVFTGFNAYRLEEGTYLRNYTSVLEREDIATGCMFNNELHIMMSNSDQYESAAEDHWTQGLSFSKINNLPKFRSSYQFLNLEGKIHTFYGYYNANVSPSNNIIHYSLDDDVWSIEPFSGVSPSTVIIMLDEIKASVSHNGNIVCIASYYINGTAVVDTYVYYSSSGKWGSVRQNNLSNEQLYYDPNAFGLNEENNRLVSCNGKLYLMGRYWRDNSGTSVAVSENMGDTWSVISGSTIPKKVKRGDAAVVGNRIHIVADDSSSGVYYHYYYNIVTNEWTLASTNLPYVNNTSNKKPIIGVLNDKLYALVRSTQDNRNVYNLYHFKGSGWVLDYDNIDSGPNPITRMVEVDGNFYMFSEHEVYKTNFENYFT